MVLSLPVLAEWSHGSREAAAFNAVAVAGHTQVGGECSCGEPGCIPDYPTECVGGVANPAGDGADVMLALFVIGAGLRWLFK
jgi:hypothetical protein